MHSQANLTNVAIKDHLFHTRSKWNFRTTFVSSVVNIIKYLFDGSFRDFPPPPKKGQIVLVSGPVFSSKAMAFRSKNALYNTYIVDDI